MGTGPTRATAGAADYVILGVAPMPQPDPAKGHRVPVLQLADPGSSSCISLGRHIPILQRNGRTARRNTQQCGNSTLPRLGPARSSHPCVSRPHLGPGCRHCCGRCRGRRPRGHRPAAGGRGDSAGGGGAGAGAAAAAAAGGGALCGLRLCTISGTCGGGIAKEGRYVVHTGTTCVGLGPGLGPGLQAGGWRQMGGVKGSAGGACTAAAAGRFWGLGFPAQGWREGASAHVHVVVGGAEAAGSSWCG